MASFLDRVKRRLLIELSPPPTTAHAYPREGEERAKPRRGAAQQPPDDAEGPPHDAPRPPAGSDLSGSVGSGVVVELTGRRELALPLGTRSVRLVVPWSRLQPTGEGEPDEAVVAEVAGAVREIRAAAERYAATAARTDEKVAQEAADPTEIHLHLAAEAVPATLAEAGGWARRGNAEAYARAVEDLAAALGGLGAAPDLWFTLVRPWAQIVLDPRNPAGATAPPWELTSEHVARAHHAALGHGLAVDALRALDPRTRVGIVLDQAVHVPADEERSADLTAVHDADVRRNHLLLGPLLEGALPVDLVSGLRGAVDFSVVRPGDLARARARLDVLGVAAPTVWRLTGGGAPEEVTDPAEHGAALFDLLRALDIAHEGLPLLLDVGKAGFGPDGTGDADGQVGQGGQDGQGGTLHSAVRRARSDAIPVIQVVAPAPARRDRGGPQGAT